MFTSLRGSFGVVEMVHDDKCITVQCLWLAGQQGAA